LFVVPFFVLWPLWQKGWNRALRVLAGFSATTATIASPWLLHTPAAWAALIAITGASSLLFLRWKTRYSSAWIGRVPGCATFTIGALTRGSSAWLKAGFLHGREHHPYLVISTCYTLPSRRA